MQDRALRGRAGSRIWVVKVVVVVGNAVKFHEHSVNRRVARQLFLRIANS